MVHLIKNKKLLQEVYRKNTSRDNFNYFQYLFSYFVSSILQDFVLVIFVQELEVQLCICVKTVFKHVDVLRTLEKMEKCIFYISCPPQLKTKK